MYVYIYVYIYIQTVAIDIYIHSQVSFTKSPVTLTRVAGDITRDRDFALFLRCLCSFLHTSLLQHA